MPPRRRVPRLAENGDGGDVRNVLAVRAVRVKDVWERVDLGRDVLERDAPPNLVRGKVPTEKRVKGENNVLSEVVAEAVLGAVGEVLPASNFAERI